MGKEVVTKNFEGNRVSNKTGWEDVEAMAGKFEQQRTPEYKQNKDGDVMFNKFGDEITFGETPYTRRVDAFPQENQEDYASSAVGIETYDGNCYFISEGVLVDKKNNKKVDLLKKRSEDAGFSFPSVKIGYKLPYDKISENLKVPDGEGGTVVKVVSYGETSAAHPNGSEMKKQVQDAIHGMIMQNNIAKQIRHIH